MQLHPLFEIRFKRGSKRAGRVGEFAHDLMDAPVAEIAESGWRVGDHALPIAPVDRVELLSPIIRPAVEKGRLAAWGYYKSWFDTLLRYSVGDASCCA